MEKRQTILAALAGLVILAGAGFWWFTQDAGEAPATAPAPATPAVMHTTVSEPLSPPAPAPVIANPAAESANSEADKEFKSALESDAIALDDEVVDKNVAEKNELASRAAELTAQVNDGAALIALKEKQIRELEAQLQKSAAQKTSAPKAPQPQASAAKIPADKKPAAAKP
ncbi:MAG: hypothetical protein PSX71_03350 [bacterium]|nr:hypothetical protein [bacterium]